MARPNSDLDLKYGIHPSPVLRRYFEARPYQGADPSTACFLFFGLDANFDYHIDKSDVYAEVGEYLDEGVAYWRAHDRHHPFLNPGYHGSGRKYHERFSLIGFGPEHAHQVSFVEIMHLPTFGVGCPKPAQLSTEHLMRLEGWVRDGSARHIFIPRTALDLLHRSKRFRWLRREPIRFHGSLPVLHDFTEREGSVYAPFHSTYRYAPPSERKQQLEDIRALIGSC